MAKIRSFGAKVYLGGVSVGGLTDVSISGGEVTTIDTTDHADSDGFREFVAGLKDGGTVELTGRYNYADAGQEDWREGLGGVVPIYIMLSDNSGFAFNAILGAFNVSNPLDDAVEFTASAKITGEVFPVFPTMTITGTLTSDGTTPIETPIVLPFTGIGTRPAYGNNDADLSWGGSSWALTITTIGTYETSQDTLTPDEATGWTAAAPTTGTPTVTGS